MKHKLLLLLCFASISLLTAQTPRLRTLPTGNKATGFLPGSEQNVLTVQPTIDPEKLIRRLFNNHCSVSNVTVKGSDRAIGLFNNGSSSIAIDSGIVLCTGPVDQLPGPNFGFTDEELLNSSSDSDLSSLNSGLIYDVISIEFDFTTTENTFELSYVFGSEDHCQYTLPSSFNDVFGIFIQGPGFNFNKNLATLPNDPFTAVNVTNINYQVNSQWYVNNVQGAGCPGIPVFAPNDCELNGWTTLLTASATVVPCAVYHIKIALADIGDRVFSSALFLKPALVNQSSTVDISVAYPNNQTQAYEGCADGGAIRFHRTDGDTSQDQTVHFTVSGSATPLEDYTPALSSPVVIPAGQSFVDVQLSVLQDGIQENIETIEITPDSLCKCLGATFLIHSAPSMQVQGNNMILPPGQSAVISTEVSGGIPPYEFSWSSGDTTALITVNTAGPYTVTVTDFCGNTSTAVFQAFAQSVGGTDCTNAGIACDFNQIFGTTPAAGTPLGIPLCGTLVVHNPVWFGFVAPSSSFNIKLTSTNCQNGDGLQMAVLYDCENLLELACDQGCSGCGSLPLTINYSNYIPGKTHWLVVDGFNGDVCDFQVELVGANQTSPPEVVTEITGPSQVCASETVVFTADAETNVGYYHWTAPAGASINGLSNDEIIEAPGGKTVTVTLGPQGGDICVKTSNACFPPSSTYCQSLNFSSDSLSVSIEETEITCANDSVVLQTNTLGQIVAYEWSGPNNFASSQSNPLVGDYGFYGVTVTNNFGCKAIASTFVQQNTVHPLIIIDGVQYPFGGSQNGYIQLTITDSPEPNTAQWYLNGVPFSTDLDIFNVGPGTYICEVTGGNGCMTTSTFQLYYVGNKDIPSMHQDWEIIPHPNSGQFILRNKKQTDGAQLIRLFDALGKVVLTTETDFVNHQASLDVSALPSGMYWIGLESGQTLLLLMD